MGLFGKHNEENSLWEKIQQMNSSLESCSQAEAFELIRRSSLFVAVLISLCENDEQRHQIEKLVAEILARKQDMLLEFCKLSKEAGNGFRIRTALNFVIEGDTEIESRLKTESLENAAAVAKEAVYGK